MRGGSGTKPLVRSTYSAYPRRLLDIRFSVSGAPVPFASVQVMSTGESTNTQPDQVHAVRRNSPHHTQASPK